MILAVILSIFVGNRFLFHVKRLHANREPWYKAYATIPGAIIILALLTPVILSIAGLL